MGVPIGTKNRPFILGTLFGWCLQEDAPPGFKIIPSKLPGTPLPIPHVKLAGWSTDKIAELLSLQIDMITLTIYLRTIKYISGLS